jgi:hypothetical protein
VKRGTRTVVVVNGPIASGKSAAARQLAGIAEQRARLHAAVIELDELWHMVDHQHPRSGDLEMWLLARRAAAALTDVFLSSGIDLVVCEGPFFTPEERDGYTRHLKTPVRVRFVTLWAPLPIRRASSRWVTPSAARRWITSFASVKIGVLDRQFATVARIPRAASGLRACRVPPT